VYDGFIPRVNAGFRYLMIVLLIWFNFVCCLLQSVCHFSLICVLAEFLKSSKRIWSITVVSVSDTGSLAYSFITFNAGVTIKILELNSQTLKLHSIKIIGFDDLKLNWRAFIFKNENYE